jgi:hypothetical protein
MKRLFALLAALAAMATIVAGSALAGGGSATCNGTIKDQVTTSNLDVPAGAVCKIVHGEVTGNVTVEGQLIVFGSMGSGAAPVQFDKNVTVNGGTINVGNGGINVAQNLTIQNSAGDSNINTQNGTPDNGTSHIGSNLIFTNNTGHLWVGYGQTVVSGNFNWANNTTVPDFSNPSAPSFTGSVVAGHTNIS